MTHLWGFTNLVPIERQMRLLGLGAFEDVIFEIISTSEVVYYTSEPYVNLKLQGCTRASFLLSVDNHVYDAFFNSPIGYRAQYCLGPDKGELANRQLIDALKPKLLAFAASVPTGALALKLVEASLDSADAKIWIDENEPASLPSSDFQNPNQLRTLGRTRQKSRRLSRRLDNWSDSGSSCTRWDQAGSEGRMA